MQGALKAINKNYLDMLPQIASVYGSLVADNDEQKSLFLSYLANGLVKKDALISWKNDEASKSLSFLEYNSLINRCIPSESIAKLSEMKNIHEFEDIMMDCACDDFTLNIRKAFVGEYFKSIYDVFNVLNKDSNSLKCAEEKEFDINDVTKEVLAHKDYKNLRKFLTTEPSKPFNAGRMNGLLSIYNESKVNKDFFTLHSYLRFIERYVLSNFDLDNNFVSVNDVRYEHIKQVKILKGVLQNHLNKPLEVGEYYIPSCDIKAPKIIVPHWGDSNGYYEITINDQGKIHTIF